MGDIVDYYVSIQNKGNVPVENPTIEDILTDGNGNSLSLTVPLTYKSTTKTITTNLGVGAVDFTSTGNGKWERTYPKSDAGHDYAQYNRTGFYRSGINGTAIGLIEFNDGRTVQAVILMSVHMMDIVICEITLHQLGQIKEMLQSQLADILLI